MNNIFQYSLLKYNHSQVLNEELVLGILFYFPHKNQFDFIYPPKLTRIKKIYFNFSESLIKSWLKSISRKVLQLNRQLHDFESAQIDQCIQKEILIEDSTALQFSKTFSSVLFSEDLNIVKENYYQLYLSHYNIEEKVYQRHDERFILREFRKSFNQISANFEKHLIKDKVIESDRVNLKFEYAWQNGSLNLIKPLSFDLSEKSIINEKAILYYGTFNFLSDVAQTENFRFDLLVSKPQTKNLFKAYENALGIISESTAPIKIIEENELKKYTIDALEYLESN